MRPLQRGKSHRIGRLRCFILCSYSSIFFPVYRLGGKMVCSAIWILSLALHIKITIKVEATSTARAICQILHSPGRSHPLDNWGPVSKRGVRTRHEPTVNATVTATTIPMKGPYTGSPTDYSTLHCYGHCFLYSAVYVRLHDRNWFAAGLHSPSYGYIRLDCKKQTQRPIVWQRFPNRMNLSWKI